MGRSNENVLLYSFSRWQLAFSYSSASRQVTKVVRLASSRAGVPMVPSTGAEIAIENAEASPKIHELM